MPKEVLNKMLFFDFKGYEKNEQLSALDEEITTVPFIQMV